MIGPIGGRGFYNLLLSLKEAIAGITGGLEKKYISIGQFHDEKGDPS
jgi:hypothetical protein